MKEMMLDLETWATSVDAEIRSIGAVVFEFDHEHAPHEFIYGAFYANLLPQFERVQSEETRKWWSDQPAETSAVFDNGKIEMRDALRDLARFYLEQGCERIWSHGATFDIPIIEHAFAAYGVAPPWSYKSVRDTRTLYEMCDVAPYPRDGYDMKHNAFHDAYNQARAVLDGKHLLALGAALGA